MAATDDERDAQRRLMAQEERAARERAMKGILDVVLNEKEGKLRDQVVRLAALAKQAARVKVAVKVFNEEGQPTTLEERVGNEDLIFMALLNQVLGRQAMEGLR